MPSHELSICFCHCVNIMDCQHFIVWTLISSFELHFPEKGQHRRNWINLSHILNYLGLLLNLANVIFFAKNYKALQFELKCVLHRNRRGCVRREAHWEETVFHSSLNTVLFFLSGSAHWKYRCMHQFKFLLPVFYKHDAYLCTPLIHSFALLQTNQDLQSIPLHK